MNNLTPCGIWYWLSLKSSIIVLTGLRHKKKKLFKSLYHEISMIFQNHEAHTHTQKNRDNSLIKFIIQIILIKVFYYNNNFEDSLGPRKWLKVPPRSSRRIHKHRSYRINRHQPCEGRIHSVERTQDYFGMSIWIFIWMVPSISTSTTMYLASMQEIRSRAR